MWMRHVTFAENHLMISPIRATKVKAVVVQSSTFFCLSIALAVQSKVRARDLHFGICPTVDRRCRWSGGWRNNPDFRE